jgi:hypothetical protein
MENTDKPSAKRIWVDAPTGRVSVSRDNTDIGQLIRDRMSSGEWWLLVPLDAESNEQIAVIEHRFYFGDANEDFDLMMLGKLSDCPVTGFYFAKKSRMSAAELAETLYAMGGVETHDELLADAQAGDIIVFGQGRLESYNRGLLFTLWAECMGGVRQESWDEVCRELALAHLRN